MNNNEFSTLVQDTKDHLKVLFDYHRHSVNIIHEHWILSQVGQTMRFLPTHGRDDTVELHDGTIYYITSRIHSIELSNLIKGDLDYMFNLYLLLPDKLWSTFIYIQYEHEYYDFKMNRFYNPKNIHEYLTDII